MTTKMRFNAGINPHAARWLVSAGLLADTRVS
jgi:hypothetical protein